MLQAAGSATRRRRSCTRHLAIAAALCVLPLAAEAQCGRTNPVMPLGFERGYPTLARGDSLSVITCSIKAAALDSLHIEPGVGVSIGEIREIFVPDSLARRGMSLRKGYHAFLVAVKVSHEAEPGKRAYRPFYAGMGREKPETLVVATHLPTLRGVTTSAAPKGATTFAVTVHDPAKDVGLDATVVLSGGCLLGPRGFIVAKVDSVQAVDELTARLFFTEKPLQRNCYANIIVRDRENNESRPRLEAEFLKP